MAELSSTPKPIKPEPATTTKNLVSTDSLVTGADQLKSFLNGNVTIDVKNLEKLEALGIKCAAKGNLLEIKLNPNVSAAVDGQPTQQNTSLTIDKNTSGVGIFETAQGIVMIVQNKTSPANLVQLNAAPAYTSAVLPSPSAQEGDSSLFSNYTPGTRYAVISIADLSKH